MQMLHTTTAFTSRKRMKLCLPICQLQLPMALGAPFRLITGELTRGWLRSAPTVKQLIPTVLVSVSVCVRQGPERDWSNLLGNQGHGVDARRLAHGQDERCDGALHHEGLQTGRYRCLHWWIRRTECLASQPETRQDHLHLSTQLNAATTKHCVLPGTSACEGSMW